MVYNNVCFLSHRSQQEWALHCFNHENESDTHSSTPHWKCAHITWLKYSMNARQDLNLIVKQWHNWPASTSSNTMQWCRRKLSETQLFKTPFQYQHITVILLYCCHQFSFTFTGSINCWMPTACAEPFLHHSSEDCMDIVCMFWRTACHLLVYDR